MPARTCGSCALCCLIPRIPEIMKPAATWCEHCTKTHGCAIHDHKPDVCKAFECMWLALISMPEELKPNKSKVYFTPAPNQDAIQVYVHPHYKNAWRKPLVMNVINSFRQKGIHVIVITSADGDRVFLNGTGSPIPVEIQNILAQAQPK